MALPGICKVGLDPHCLQNNIGSESHNLGFDKTGVSYSLGMGCRLVLTCPCVSREISIGWDPPLIRGKHGQIALHILM